MKDKLHSNRTNTQGDCCGLAHLVDDGVPQLICLGFSIGIVAGFIVIGLALVPAKKVCDGNSILNVWNEC